MRVLNIWRNHPQKNNITQLRLGRIVGLENKGQLRDVSDADIAKLLTSRSNQQRKEDERRLGQIEEQRKQYA